MANVTDNKKVQTAINAVGTRILLMRQLMTEISAMRTKFQSQNPDVTGTPLAGKLAALNTALNTLGTDLQAQVLTDVIAAIVSSHNEKALD